VLAKLQKSIKNYFKTHCLPLFHDWIEIDGPTPGVKSSEQYYWVHVKCLKCGKETGIMIA
jgi:hypothetical protein